MKTSTARILPLALALSLAIPLSSSAQETPIGATATAPVTVEVADFNGMQEVKRLHGKQRSDTESQIQSLAKWLGKRAQSRVPDGQTLAITLNDVDLAGDYEPSAGIDMQYVRVVRDMYPPRITLSWQVNDTSGKTVDQGQAQLTDPSFLHASTPVDSHGLGHEKRLLKDWLRKQFPKQG